MKKIIYLLCFLTAPTLFGQGIFNVNSQPDRWRLGGGVGLSFGDNDFFGVSVSPFLGYVVSPTVEAGVSVGYRYSKWEYTKQNLFSAGPYINYYPMPLLFARVHYKYYTGSTQVKQTGNAFHFNENALWVGGGYRSLGKVQFYAGLMYNVLYDESSSIFSNGLKPIVGVSIGL